MGSGLTARVRANKRESAYGTRQQHHLVKVLNVRQHLTVRSVRGLAWRRRPRLLSTALAHGRVAEQTVDTRCFMWWCLQLAVGGAVKLPMASARNVLLEKVIVCVQLTALGTGLLVVRIAA